MAEPSPPADPAPQDAPTVPATGLWSTLVHYASLVRLSHTIFGLPFTLASAILAHRAATTTGLGDGVGMTWLKLVWIVLAFTGARTAAMGFNRIVDRDIDAANPRTANRELPAGKISLRAAIVLTVLASAVFVGAAGALGTTALLLSPLCLVIVGGYSLFKRFSWSAHLILGLALALGPGGAWVAITGGLEGALLPSVMMVAVGTWVAGFDILYSLQDRDFDLGAGLNSIPARFGVRGSLVFSAALHLLTAAALGALHWLAGMGPAHLVGAGLVVAILIYEHWIVRPDDLSRIDKAFFDLNGWISIAYFAAVLLDIVVLPALS
ncbi:4-hydroxybenzoate polyprenyltransferase-related protein [Plesiocystis pacifica SIR-1]|uniref:4-hydroxybenzoate polyprenyltransferase n=1 Tax=Plesiocystis pacifica SIR-1 TaxID=391625 RepID=A6G9R6_9BACT|nr:UbiA-like polyprenyltransferase [Plesiocystis pacifica]EDM77352.1 4-hydroxybenzoate polyprenyltransferase-related protein [Plesiocystis pacifica SIR-1]